MSCKIHDENRKRIYKLEPLAGKVLAVAVAHTDIKDWAAYIDAVPGIDHEEEYLPVTQMGDKLPRNLAELIFPEFAETYKWRR